MAAPLNAQKSEGAPGSKIEDIELNFDINDDYILPSTTPIIDLLTFIPYYFLNNKTKKLTYKTFQKRSL